MAPDKEAASMVNAKNGEMGGTNTDLRSAEATAYSNALDCGTEVSAGAEENIEADQIETWARRLEVSEEQLRVAIGHVGPRVNRVRRFLANPDVL